MIFRDRLYWIQCFIAITPTVKVDKKICGYCQCGRQQKYQYVMTSTKLNVGDEDRKQVSLTAIADCRLPSAAAARRRGPSGLALPISHLPVIRQADSTAKKTWAVIVAQAICTIDLNQWEHNRNSTNSYFHFSIILKPIVLCLLSVSQCIHTGS